MRVELGMVNCSKQDGQTRMKRIFRIAEVIFDMKSSKLDETLLKKIIAKGEALAKNVNSSAANDSTFQRNLTRVTNNCIAGILAEYLWKTFLNLVNLDTIVIETPFDSASSQVDLKSIDNKMLIEVRSSFPRNGIEFALCDHNHEFDVIGPYSNSYKPSEPQKHLYLRTLFPFESEQIVERMHASGFGVYLTGGATWEMISDDKIAIEKDFIPDDQTDIRRLGTKSKYRVVPFSRAMDTVDAYLWMKQRMRIEE